MNKPVNISDTDRVIRFILGGAALGFGIAFGPVSALLGGLIAAVLWLSASMGYCHVYEILGISTSKH
ncbi:MAG: DUF2892 domain-containing protein [Coriobacteriia bacterium]|nr:DUF2892 domain-containing protein [Coriobacteriia bacterium]